jgi:hypothetical protein
MTYRGMMIAIPPQHWEIFHSMSQEQFCQTLLQLAAPGKTVGFSLSSSRAKEEKEKADLRPPTSSCFYRSTSGKQKEDLLTRSLPI